MSDIADPPPQTPKRVVKPHKRRFASARTTAALMLREVAASNSRVAGGYLWAILEPAAGIVLLTVIFSIGFRSPPIGTSFPLFYASGLVPFTMYLALGNTMASAILSSRALLAYPTVTFVDALLAKLLVALLTQIMVAYIIFTAIFVAFDTRTIVDIARVFEAFVMTTLLAAGVGTMNCYLFSAFPVWQKVWMIFNRPLLIISCIFFVFETIPQPYRDWLWYNPLVHVVGMSRSGFYQTYDADYVSRLYVYSISLGLLLLGLIFLKRYYRDLIDRS